MRTRSLFSISLIALSALVSGCVRNILDIPTPIASSVSAYQWDPTAGPITYTSTHGSSTTNITLSFIANAQANGYNIVENYGSGSRTDTLMLSTNANSYSVSGFTQYSVISVPNNFSLRTVTYDTTRSFATLTRIYVADTLVVAADDSGYFYTCGTRSQLWKRTTSSKLSSDDRVKQFVSAHYSGGLCIGALTDYGRFYYTTNLGSTWTAATIPGVPSISAISSDGDSIYAAISKVGIYSFLGTGFVSKPDYTIPYSDTTFTSFAAVSKTTGEKAPKFIIGGVRGIHYSGTNNWTILDTQSAFFFIPGDSSTFVSYGKTSSGAVQLLPIDLKKNIPGIPIAAPALLASGAFDPYGTGTFYLLSETGNIYNYNFNATSVSPVASSITPNSIAAAYNGALYVSTHDSGAFILPYNQSSWTRFGDGLLLSHYFMTYVPNSVTLLSAGSSGLSTGTTWPAGTIFDTVASLNIVATVSKHLDSLQLANHIGFSDVFVVTYTLADHSGVSLTTLPEWTIYYGKNEGPLLIQETQNGVLQSSTYRSSK